MHFECMFELDCDSEVILHVSADQRFELYGNHRLIGIGPDRSDVDHWSFHSYRLKLNRGRHRLSARVDYLSEAMPLAQMTHKPGFICLSEDGPVDLTTGSAPWRVYRDERITLRHFANLSYHVVGPGYCIDGRTPTGSWCEPVVARAPINSLKDGTIRSGWKLHPTPLPEQMHARLNAGRIRMVSPGDARQVLHETDEADTRAWQRLISGDEPLTIEPACVLSALWDLERYACCFTEAILSGGRDAEISVLWDESCYEHNHDGVIKAKRAKGNRNDIEHKHFLGFGDTFISNGEADQCFRAPWWRAGRYVMITVTTRAEPLTIENIKLQQTRYPFENEGSFHSDDTELAPVERICAQGILMNAHETFIDCPFYEQLNYTGDSRVQMLASYVMNTDTHLQKRCIELFDWSRAINGFVLERYPSTPYQMSCTFGLLWISMLRDFAWWRRDDEFVKQMLAGVRGMLEEVRRHLGEQTLLNALPGWSFIDWVPEWDTGYAPGGEGISAVNNLLLLTVLKDACDLEREFGNPHLFAYHRELYVRLAGAIFDTFWCPQRGMFADDVAQVHFSEHAQSLAILCGAFDAEVVAQCGNAVSAGSGLSKATVYFAYYVHEALSFLGKGAELLPRFARWKVLDKMGFKTPIEQPEPSRSDCHGFASHPLFHMHATLAGIRPDAPGFRAVRIAPQVGPLREIHCRSPHPDGVIAVQYAAQDCVDVVSIDLPRQLDGILAWRGTEYPLAGGSQSFTFDRQEYDTSISGE
ncbi:MAG: Bacterial alpha-L-rhamnosidase [Chitinivibrionales bacterium]|nr:Bacterial alpha-L-rhamnosidase [Chitinivibrionales bacterium]